MYKKKVKFFKVVIVNTIIIFLLGFLVHNMYKWAPSFLTTIFPVNESLYEHMKLIFISPIIVGIVWYLTLSRHNKRDYHNYFFSLYVTVMANIAIFYALYLPIYYRFGENMIVTLVIYFISIFISQIINMTLLSKTSENHLVNIIGIVLLIIDVVVLLFFTYNPMMMDFFFDPVSEIYGIPR